jgi:hypothetical protein
VPLSGREARAILADGGVGHASSPEAAGASARRGERVRYVTADRGVGRFGWRGVGSGAWRPTGASAMPPVLKRRAPLPAVAWGSST